MLRGARACCKSSGWLRFVFCTFLLRSSALARELNHGVANAAATLPRLAHFAAVLPFVSLVTTTFVSPSTSPAVSADATESPDDCTFLARFTEAQEDRGSYLAALSELHAGKKTGHWMWYVFPQHAALGHSQASSYFGINSMAQARAYLLHAVLAPRLREAAAAALAAAAFGHSALELMGNPDDMKLRSCMTLFEAAAPPASDDARLFAAVLDALFGGDRDELTLGLLTSELRGHFESSGAADGGWLPSCVAAAAACFAAIVAALAAVATLPARPLILCVNAVVDSERTLGSTGKRLGSGRR